MMSTLTKNVFTKISGLPQPFDQRLIKKIRELVHHEINHVSEMKRYLQYYLKWRKKEALSKHRGIRKVRKRLNVQG